MTMFMSFEDRRRAEDDIFLRSWVLGKVRGQANLINLHTNSRRAGTEIFFKFLGFKIRDEKLADTIECASLIALTGQRLGMADDKG